MTLQEQIGKAIVKLRKQRGLSQEKFANESGIDRRYMSDIENGKRNLSLDVIERLARSLYITPSELFSIAESIANPLTQDELKKYLCEQGHDEAILFEAPDYVEAVVGVTIEGRVLYDYETMVDYHVEHDGMEYGDAADLVSYGAIRALSYMGENAPIVIEKLKI